MKKIIILTVVGIVALLAISVFFTYVSVNNNAIQKYKACGAQNGNIEAVHNEMWTILKDQAKVPAAYADNFDKIYTDMIGGRYSKGDGTLMKWIQESNPKFDNTLYVTLMNSIEIQRTNFANQQKRMIDMKRDYDTYITQIPAKWFVTKENSKQFVYVPISCSVTKEVMKTRVDDNEISL